MSMRPPPKPGGPPVKSGSEIDWDTAKRAAEDIVKQCNDAWFAPPEATDIHFMRLNRVCRALDTIIDALRLKHSEWG